MGDIQEEDIYEQAEINQAREDLKNMTPEDLLSLRGALDRAMANLTLPEAAAICFTEVYSATGNKINITCRGVSGKHALDDLADTLRYAKQTYNMDVASNRPVAPTAPTNEPQYVAPEETQSNTVVVDIDVIGITRERKRDGKGDFLRVRGGVFTKFGAPAYDSVVPQTLDINKMTHGIEMSPPPGMTKAKVQAEMIDGKYSHAKVISFS